MTGAAFLGRPRTLRLEIAACLIIGLSACSFGSLDHLKNGQRLDGSAGDVPAGLGDDVPAPVPDAAMPDAPVDLSAEPDTDGMGEDGGTHAEAGSGDGAGIDGWDAGKDGKDAGRTGGSSGSASTRDGGAGSGGKASTGGTGAGGVSGTGGLGGSHQSGGQQADAGFDAPDDASPDGTGGVGGVSATGGALGGSGGALSSTSQSSALADASLDTVGGDTPLPRCAGVEDSGICWYLGASGDSCSITCAAHGGASPRAASHVGIASQGGSASECGRLLGLLGQSGTVFSTGRSDGEGFGCVVALGFHVWVSAPAYSDSASDPNAQIVCGCLE